MTFPPVGTAEHRLLGKNAGFGSHMADYGRDLGRTYFSNKKGLVDRAGSAAMAGLSVVLEGTDQLYDAVLGREYIAPAGIAGRTRRDLKLLFKDIFAFHPLRAAGDIWRLGTSDWILDGGDMITGNRLNAGMASTRKSISSVITPRKPIMPKSQSIRPRRIVDSSRQTVA